MMRGCLHVYVLDSRKKSSKCSKERIKTITQVEVSVGLETIQYWSRAEVKKSLAKYITKRFQ